MLIPDDAAPMHTPLRFLFDSLSVDHRTLDEADGLCFRTVIVGVSNVLQFRFPCVPC